METTNQHLLVLEKWDEYKINTPWYASDFAHHSQAMKGTIEDALFFWQFVRNKSHFYFDNALHMRTEIKRNFLRHVLSDKKLSSNKFIKLIAQIEMMPTSVWRKMLWRYNIDFQSFESFLRRIKSGQIELIEQNWNDLFVDFKLPRVIKASLRSRIAYAFKRHALKKILAEDICDDCTEKNRYLSKGAWAYSLLGLDFGFGRYPHGTEDDTEIRDRDFSRFFSIKNHINDFVVNQEDGKYWWLYQKARKNFVWKCWSNKEVELKTHICPGFWATLLVHLLFWVISPILFVNGVTLFAMQDHLTWQNITLMSLGSLTPTWLLFAGVRIVLTVIYIIGSSIVDFVEETETGERIWKVIKYKLFPATVIFVIIVILSAVIMALFLGPREWLEHTLLRNYATSLSVIFGGLFLTSMISSILIGDAGDGTIFEDFFTKETCRSLWAVTLGVLISYLILGYFFHVMAFLRFMYHGIITAGYWCAAHWMEITQIIVSIIGFIAIARPIYYLFHDERKYLRTSRYMLPVSIIWCVTLVALYIIKNGFHLYMPDGFFSSLLVVSLYFCLGVGICALVIYFAQRNQITEERVEHKEKIDLAAAQARNSFRHAFDWNRDENDRLLSLIKYSLYRNEWLSRESLTKDTEIVFDHIANDIKELFSNTININDKIGREYVMRFLSVLLPTMDKDTLPQLKKYRKRLFISESIDDLVGVYTKFRDNNNLSDALKKQKEHKEQISKMKARRQALWDGFSHAAYQVIYFVFSPLRWLYKILLFIYTWIKNKKDDLMNLWELFNQRCPYVNQSRPLE